MDYLFYWYFHPKRQDDEGSYSIFSRANGKCSLDDLIVNICLVLQLLHFNETNSTFFSTLEQFCCKFQQCLNSLLPRMELSATDKQRCDTGQKWRKLFYRADMKKSLIRGRHEWSCDTGQTWRQLWYRANIKKAVLQGRHEKSVLQGRHEWSCGQTWRQL